jgi:hypothetical protein
MNRKKNTVAAKNTAAHEPAAKETGTTKQRAFKPIPKVEVVIRFGENKILVEPVEIKFDQEVRWRCDIGDLKVQFSPRSNPFRGVTYAVTKGGSCYSGKPVKSRNGAYNYAILVTTAKGIMATDSQLTVTGSD